MAQYRLSSQVIGRSTGRSAVAAAAYRSGQSLADERTGQLHDFSRKRGIAHAEIMAPDNAPEWMRDRAQLWNAVERIETRVNSQLAREIQISLPHELTDAQRLELVRGFVAEQFVDRGMIADIAIHRPDHQSDDRNFHAHVMLTMRELTAGGFHSSKATETARSWNDTALLETWREQWAVHQNRTLERYGHPDRVDHRSFAAQGIDREATQHMGPRAHGIEQRGECSRIGDENRAVDARNSERAGLHREAAVINLDLERFRRQHAQTEAERMQALDGAQKLSRLDLERKLHSQTLKFEGQLAERFGQTERTLQAETKAAQERAATTGWKRLLRKVTGAEARDRQAIEANTATLGSIAQRKAELTADHQREKADQLRAFEQRQQEQRDNLKREMSKEATAREKQILAAQAAKAREARAEIEAQARAKVQHDMQRVRAAAERQQASMQTEGRPRAFTAPQKPAAGRQRSAAIERQAIEGQAARTDREKTALRLEVERQQADQLEPAKRNRKPRMPRVPRADRAARQASVEQQARQKAAPKLEQKPMQKPFDDARRMEKPAAPKYPHEPQRVNVAEPRLAPQGMPQPRPAQVQQAPKSDHYAQHIRNQQPAAPAPARKDFRQVQTQQPATPAQTQPASRHADQLPSAKRDFREAQPAQQKAPQRMDWGSVGKAEAAPARKMDWSDDAFDKERRNLKPTQSRDRDR